MNNFDITSELINVQTTFVTGKELAKLLGVTTAAVSDAIKHDNQCGGQPICEWADFYDSGRVKGYHVPNHLFDELTRKQQESGQQQKDKETRDNPDSIKLNSSNSKQNSVNKEPVEKEPVNQSSTPVTNVYKSFLPQDQDYSRTAGMVSLPQVLIKALGEDTPQSRAVIGFSSGAIGALIGGAVTESAGGAIAGALLGWGGTWLTYKFAGKNKQPDIQPRFTPIKRQKAQNTKDSVYANEVKPLQFDYV